MRRCGHCSACCVEIDVVELKKRTHTRCPLQGAHRGCSIHGTDAVPDACTTFMCQWLLGMGSNADRPDKIGVIFIQRPPLMNPGRPMHERFTRNWIQAVRTPATDRSVPLHPRAERIIERIIAREEVVEVIHRFTGGGGREATYRALDKPAAEQLATAILCAESDAIQAELDRRGGEAE